MGTATVYNPLSTPVQETRSNKLYFSIGFRGLLYYVKDKQENTLSLGYKLSAICKTIPSQT